MRILYAIQGTGNGHLSRATDILPQLFKRAEVDILISGIQSEIRLPYHITYRLHGLSFIFGRRGGIDYLDTFRKNSLNRFLDEVKSLPVKDYDLVINDFEPVSAWAARWNRVPCYSLSHQAALLSHQVPKPFMGSPLGQLILRYYAPADMHYGFHFQNYDKGITYPSIRPEVRAVEPVDRGFYLVYLPAFDEQRITEVLSMLPNTHWKVYSKKGKKRYAVGNVDISPVDGKEFTQDLGRCSGVLCGAGFETPAEAMHLGKKLMVVPMRGQYEQKLNAMALKRIGVPVLKRFDQGAFKAIHEWVHSGDIIRFEYPEVGKQIVDDILVGFIGREIA